MKGQELHVKIATIHYPPFVFHDEELDRVYGIEPSLLHMLAEKLNFTYEYIFAAPDEMWGEITDFGNGNLTITGLVGMLHRGEVDVALGDLYLNYDRKKYIDYTRPYGTVYECFMVPAPPPYPKWTALYEPFQWPVWVAMLFSFAFAALTLRLAAKLRNATPTFNDIYLCILFVLGHVLGMHQSHQGIRSIANRFLFIVWLLCTFVIATIYRSELISYMTSPYTPPPIDTIQQLINSFIGKIAYGNFIRDSMLTSDIPMLKELGQQLTVTYNLTHLFSLLETGSWAMLSSKESHEYEIAHHFYKNNNTKNRMHIMMECVLPAFVTFGLKKNSPLQSDIDYAIQKLLESGFIKFHRSEFAKKSTEKLNQHLNRNDILEPLSLNDLQGAFYLLLMGFLLSFICFVTERIAHRLNVLYNGNKQTPIIV